MLKGKRSPSGRRRQKPAPGLRCAAPCHGFCALAVRRSGSLPVWRAVFKEGCLCGRQPSATPFLSAPCRPPGPCIFDFAVRCAPGETKVEGAACCGSVCARPFRCAPGPAQTLTPAARGEWRAGAEYRFLKNEQINVCTLRIVTSWERFGGE